QRHRAANRRRARRPVRAHEADIRDLRIHRIARSAVAQLKYPDARIRRSRFARDRAAQLRPRGPSHRHGAKRQRYPSAHHCSTSAVSLRMAHHAQAIRITASTAIAAGDRAGTVAPPTVTTAGAVTSTSPPICVADGLVNGFAENTSYTTTMFPESACPILAVLLIAY